MKRWHSLIEIFQFPLKLLFIACFLVSLSSLVLNDNVSVYWTIDSELVVQFAYLIKTIGNFIIVNFPFFVLVKVMARKGGSQGIQMEMGVLGYIVFLITTMFFSVQDLPSYAYSSVFGLSLSASKIAGLSSGTQYPLQTGLFGALAVGLVARKAYRSSRNKSQYGFFSFIDKNSYAAILTLTGSFLAGLAFVLIWPLVITSLNDIFEFIASDINNPMNLFVYGILDRVLSVFNLGGMLRNSFWFTDMGGAWIDLAGSSYVGDVSIWTAQVVRGSYPLGYGRFITPYYVLNLFAVPGMLMALYTLFTDKFERRRYRLFFVLAALVSLLGGTLLPLEIFLFIMAPLLFVMHVLVSGCLFGVLQAMNVNLGFSYSGNTVAAMPGNLFDMLIYTRNPEMIGRISTICIVGIIFFFLYFLMTRLYYNHLADDLFNSGLTKKRVEGFLLASGGLENIRTIQSSLFRLTIQVQDASLINFEQYQRLGASKVFETRSGYAIQFGAGSTILKNRISRRMKEAKRTIK